MKTTNPTKKPAPKSPLSQNPKPVKIKPSDVLLGRGNISSQNPSNIALRYLITQRRPEYQNAKNKNEKSLIAQDIYNTLSNNGIRFIDPDPNTNNHGMKISMDKAVEILKQKFREKNWSNIQSLSPETLNTKGMEPWRKLFSSLSLIPSPASPVVAAAASHAIASVAASEEEDKKPAAKPKARKRKLKEEAVPSNNLTEEVKKKQATDRATRAARRNSEATSVASHQNALRQLYTVRFQQNPEEARAAQAALDALQKNGLSDVADMEVPNNETIDNDAVSEMTDPNKDNW